MSFVRFLIAFALLLLISCQQKSNESSSLDSNLEKAENLVVQKKYNEAYLFYNKSLEHNQTIKNNKRVVYCLLKMAEIEKIECDYNTSEHTITKAISLFNKETPVPYWVNAYIGLGLNFTHLNNFSEGIKYYTKALEITDDELSKCIIQNNIAYLYSKHDNYKKAVEILSSIENEKVLLDNPLEYARVLHNKGYFLFYLNSPDALPYMQKALAIRETNKDDSEIVSSYMHLATYFAKSNKTIATKWAQNAYTSATKANIPDDRLEALNLLFKTTENNNLKDLYHNQYFRTNDSLTKARQFAKNQFAKIKYDNEKAEIEKAEYQFKMWIYIVLLLLSITVFILIYSISQLKNKRKISETKYQTETQIAKRLHDELANDVHNTIAFAETQNLEDIANKEHLLDSLDTIYSRTRNISNENKEIQTGSNFVPQLKNMITSYSNDKTNVILQSAELNHMKWTKEIQITVYRVLQELMVNMKKHSNCSLVAITFKTTNSHLEINYSDNGKGANSNLFIKNGLQNVENRIFSLKGSITFETEPEKGFKVKITIPN